MHAMCIHFSTFIDYQSIYTGVKNNCHPPLVGVIVFIMIESSTSQKKYIFSRITPSMQL
jgi:hypothetical protein